MGESRKKGEEKKWEDGEVGEMREESGSKKKKRVDGEYNEGEHTWDEGWLMDLHNLG